jgi:hypothetical protein
MPQGTYGKLKAFSHFLDQYSTVLLTGATPLGGGVSIIGVEEGSIASTLDEPGGLLAITTDTADNDNQFLVAGPFKPQDGGMVMEARFKLSVVTTTTCAVFCGFSETLSQATPVMPAEYATATLAINGTGGMAGVVFDTDGTVIDFRSVIADAGAVLAGTKCAGDALGATVTADRFYIVRVEVSNDGYAKVYFGDADDNKKLMLVAQNTVPLDDDVCYFACLGIENRTGAARAFEVDMFGGESWVDWSVA